jgi:hypothetical protein
MQFFLDSCPGLLSATYLASSIPQAWWLGLIGGVLGGYLVFWLARSRFEPFEVCFYINFFKVLTGIGLISLEEGREYNGASKGINLLEPMRKIKAEGARAVVIGLYDRERKAVVHWPQTDAYSLGFKFKKNLDMVPRHPEFEAFPPDVFIRPTPMGYAVGITVPTYWWEAHKDGDDIKKFVTAVESEMWTTDLILVVVPSAVFAPYYGGKSVFFWDKQLERADRIAEASGLKKETGQHSRYSNEFFTVTARLLSW